MPADLTPVSWVLDVDRDRLVRDHGIVVVMRGESYAAEGRVRTLVSGPGGGMLLATVSGTHRMLYQTLVRRIGEVGSQWVGQCSCPVAVDCKHAVAAIIEAQRRLLQRDVGVGSSWESVLAPMVRAGAPAAGHPAGHGEPPAERVVPKRLGVEVSLEPGRGGHDAARVLLRPLTPGKSRAWIRTGVSWRDLSSQWASPGVSPSQRTAVSQLHAVAQGNGHYHRFGLDQLELGDLPPVAWLLLRQCLAAGVELVPGRGITEVELGEGTAEATVDLMRDEDGGLTLRPWLTADRQAQGPGRHLLIGRPAHGLGHLDERGRLLLWPLAEAPTDAAVRLLQLTEPMRIPAAEVDRFLALYYPTMARLVSLSSLDGSVPEVATARPTLRLRVSSGAGHLLELAWSMRYAVPTASGEPGEIELPLGTDPAGAPRDERTEDELLAAVVPLLEAMPWLVDHHTGRPPLPVSSITLSGQHTARFVTEILPRLQDQPDLEIVLDGELADYGEALEPPVVHLSTTGAETQDWFDLHVTVTVAGQQVPFEELFAALARDEEVLLLESGTWFNLRQTELTTLRQLIEEARELDDRPPGEATVRLSPYQAGLWEELVRLGVVEEQSLRWEESVAALLRLGDADRGVIPTPSALRATLRPYQLDGYRWLSTLWDSRLGGILADDMGLGKTVQLLAMIVRAEGRGDLADGPVLVVAPTSVVGTWAAEAAKFAPELRVVSINGTRRRRGVPLPEAVGAADLVITSYTLLRLEETAYAALPWSAVVLDEAQFVKNHRSATYQAVRKLAPRRCYAITGTPLENNLMDLWSMTSLAAPGLFPRPEQFRERYRKPIEAGEAPQVLERLRRRLRPFMLRRTKGEVATELPKKSEQTLSVALHPAHQRIYDKHLQRERQRVLGLLEDLDKNRMAIFRALTTLRQLALDPSLVDDGHAGLATSAKVSTLVEQLTELAAEGHRALVFSSFTGFLSTVRGALEEAGINYSYLDGRTRNRAARIEAFKDGDDPVFLISLKAGGFGLTLTEADYVFVLDPWWNPAAEAQAVDRTHRIGQTRPVHVYRFVSTGTIEEKVVALQERKRDLFATVIDSGQFRSSAISADEIASLLAD